MWLVLEILLFLLPWLSEYLPHLWLCLYPALLSDGRGTDVCLLYLQVYFKMAKYNLFHYLLKSEAVIKLYSYHVQALLVGSVCILSFKLILLQLLLLAYVY